MIDLRQFDQEHIDAIAVNLGIHVGDCRVVMRDGRAYMVYEPLMAAIEPINMNIRSDGQSAVNAICDAIQAARKSYSKLARKNT